MLPSFPTNQMKRSKTGSLELNYPILLNWVCDLDWLYHYNCVEITVAALTRRSWNDKRGLTLSYSNNMKLITWLELEIDSSIYKRWNLLDKWVRPISSDFSQMLWKYCFHFHHPFNCIIIDFSKKLQNTNLVDLVYLF